MHILRDHRPPAILFCKCHRSRQQVKTYTDVATCSHPLHDHLEYFDRDCAGNKPLLHPVAEDPADLTDAERLEEDLDRVEDREDAGVQIGGEVVGKIANGGDHADPGAGVALVHAQQHVQYVVDLAFAAEAYDLVKADDEHGPVFE